MGSEANPQLFVEDKAQDRVDSRLGKCHPDCGGQVHLRDGTGFDKDPQVTCDYIWRPQQQEEHGYDVEHPAYSLFHFELIQDEQSLVLVMRGLSDPH